jgi:hypothetical protein
MSQENVEIVQRSIETWNQHNLSAAAALWNPDGEIDWSRSRGPLKGIYRGQGEREIFWSEFMLVYTIENGAITRMRMFQEGAEALEAVGLGRG